MQRGENNRIKIGRNTKTISMINLTSLIIIPLIFIGFVLSVSSNYKNKSRLVETNSLKHITLLEENKYILPTVLRKYYLNVINISSNLFPSLLSTSF